MLSEDFAHALYRVAQETVENILRHAGAKNVAVNLFQDGKSVVLSIKDDGVGLDLDETDLLHMGIRGMRERVEMLGGEFTIDSRKGQGTEVKAVLDRGIG